MSERILDEFADFDEEPPVEHVLYSAKLIRNGKRHAAEGAVRGAKAIRSIGARQRQSYTTRKSRPKITLATKA